MRTLLKSLAVLVVLSALLVVAWLGVSAATGPWYRSEVILRPTVVEEEAWTYDEDSLATYCGPSQQQVAENCVDVLRSDSLIFGVLVDPRFHDLGWADTLHPDPQLQAQVLRRSLSVEYGPRYESIRLGVVLPDDQAPQWVIQVWSDHYADYREEQIRSDVATLHAMHSRERERAGASLEKTLIERLEFLAKHGIEDLDAFRVRLQAERDVLSASETGPVSEAGPIDFDCGDDRPVGPLVKLSKELSRLDEEIEQSRARQMQADEGLKELSRDMTEMRSSDFTLLDATVPTRVWFYWPW